MRLYVMLLFTSLLCSEEVEGKHVHDLPSALMVCDTATVGIASGQAVLALTNLIQDHWYRPTAINEDTKKLTGPFGASGLVIDHYGSPIEGKNWDYIGTDAISDIAYRIFYMVKMENGYMPIMYTWYNRGNKWILFGVLWGNTCEQNLEKFRVIQK
jgi:hypothetical protein